MERKGMWESMRRKQMTEETIQRQYLFPMIYRSGLYALLWFASFSAVQSKAQSPPANQEAYDFVYRSWNNQTGLPQNTVYDMAQDSAGYLWGATEEGLFRFDGAEFTVVNESNTEGLHSNTFYDLLSSGKDLWASSRNAVIRISNKVDQIWDLRGHVSGGWIKCIEKDTAGRIWIGTSSGRLYYIQNNAVHACPQWKRGTEGAIEDLHYTSRGMIIGTSRGVFSMNDPETMPREIAYFKGIAITAITQGHDDELWIGTANKGLFRFSGDTTQYTQTNGLKENFIKSLYSGRDGKLWIGLRSAGYQLFYKEQFITPEQTRYAHDGIQSILTTNEHFVWMGTTSSGLLQLKPATIGVPIADIQLSDKIILAIYQHDNGETWVGTAGRGVHRFYQDKLTTYNQANGLSNNLVLSLYGRGDHIFIGTSNGMDRFNRKKGMIDRHYTEKDGLQNNGILSIFNDSRNRLWISTRMGGLQRMADDESIKPFDLPASMGHSDLISAFEDSKHNIWIGSKGAGILRIDERDQTFHYYQKQGVPADIIYGFYEDKQGGLWMATEKGLLVYSNGRFKLFDKESGLLFNETYRLLEDSRGYLWLSGNLGLQRISMKDLLNAKNSDSLKTRLPVRLFNVIDGMPNSETNGGFFPAGWPMQDETLWFPTAQGVAVVDNRLIKEESNTLNIEIQSLRYGNNEYFPSDSILLPPGVYNFEIRYTSIDFSKAADIQFYFRLKDLDNEWTHAGNRHITYFSALAPGDYTFEVKAERYGYWSPTATLHFSVQPYFYQTSWFKILVILLALLIIAGFAWYLKKSAQRKISEQQNITRAQINGQEKERQFISTELHDNINQQLATAKIYLDHAKTNEAVRADLLGRSEAVVQNVINDIRLLCNSLTPRTLKDIGLKEAIEDLLNSYTPVQKFTIHSTFTLLPEELEEDLQFTLFRITQEQMQNIVRHSNASNVWVDYNTTQTAITVSIRDDGKGFDLKTQQFGMGFENIKNRLLLYQGKMEIKTAPGKGCTLLLYIPLKKSS